MDFATLLARGPGSGKGGKGGGRRQTVAEALTGAAESLKARFHLRRVLIESAESGRSRTREELDKIHRFLCRDTNICDVPWWGCLQPSHQRHLCELLELRTLDHDSKSQAILIDGSCVYILLTGKATVTKHDADGAKLDGGLIATGGVFGRIDLPEPTRDALMFERTSQLRNLWLEENQEVVNEQGGGAAKGVQVPDFPEVDEMFKDPAEGESTQVTVVPGSDFIVIDSKRLLPFLSRVSERAVKLRVLKPIGLACLMECSTQHSAPAGTVLIHQGDKPSSVLIMVHGECRLVKLEDERSVIRKFRQSVKEKHAMDIKQERFGRMLNKHHKHHHSARSSKNLHYHHRSAKGLRQSSIQASDDATTRTSVGSLPSFLPSHRASIGRQRRGSLLSVRTAVDDISFDDSSHGSFDSPRNIAKLGGAFLATVDMKQLAVLGPQALIGEVPVLLGGAQPASVVAAVGVTYLVVSAQQLMAQLNTHAEVLATMRQHAQRRLEWILDQFKHDDGFDDNATASSEVSDLSFEQVIFSEAQLAEYDKLKEQSAFNGWTPVPSDSRLISHDDYVRPHTPHQQHQRLHNRLSTTIQAHDRPPNRPGSPGSPGSDSDSLSSASLAGVGLADPIAPEPGAQPRSRRGGWQGSPSGSQPGSRSGSPTSCTPPGSRSSSRPGSRPGSGERRRSDDEASMALAGHLQALAHGGGAEEEERPSLSTTVSSIGGGSSVAPPHARFAKAFVRDKINTNYGRVWYDGKYHLGHTSKEFQFPKSPQDPVPWELLPRTTAASSLAPDLSTRDVTLAVSIDPLLPFPTLTRKRHLHARPLPLVDHSNGFIDPWHVQQVHRRFVKMQRREQGRLMVNQRGADYLVPKAPLSTVDRRVIDLALAASVRNMLERANEPEIELLDYDEAGLPLPHEAERSAAAQQYPPLGERPHPHFHPSRPDGPHAFMYQPHHPPIHPNGFNKVTMPTPTIPKRTLPTVAEASRGSRGSVDSDSVHSAGGALLMTEGHSIGSASIGGSIGGSASIGGGESVCSESDLDSLTVVPTLDSTPPRSRAPSRNAAL